MTNQTTDASREAWNKALHEWLRTDQGLGDRVIKGCNFDMLFDLYKKEALSTKQPMPSREDCICSHYEKPNCAYHSYNVDAKQPMPLSEDEAVEIMGVADCLFRQKHGSLGDMKEQWRNMYRALTASGITFKKGNV